MAYTQTQLDALEAAIAQGVLEVEHNGRRVRYRSAEEMQNLRRQMRAELGLTDQRSTRRFGEFYKGLS